MTQDAIRTVLFDLDGTILDTNELIFQSFEFVWKSQGIADMTRERMTPLMGAKLTDMFLQATGADESELEEMIRLYREFNLVRHNDLVKPFPYVEPVLAQLKEAGMRLGVVTTKIRQTSEMGLRHCGLDGYMETIVSLDDVVNAKPDPEPVLTALRRLDAEAASTVMVGDSPADILAAKSAGVRSIAVGWSIKSRAQLQKCEPDDWIDDMRELPRLVGITRDKS